MIFKLLLKKLNNCVTSVQLTITYLTRIGFIIVRKLVGFFIIGVWIRFYAGSNPLIWTRLLECFCSSLFIEDLLHVIPREHFISFISDKADILYAARLGKIRASFELAFALWNSGEYLTSSPAELAQVIKNAQRAFFSLSPLLNFSDWLKLWAITLQPLTPLSGVYTVYTKTKFLYLNYNTFIRYGVLGCSAISKGADLPARELEDCYTAFVWILASVCNFPDLDVNPPNFRKIVKP